MTMSGLGCVGVRGMRRNLDAGRSVPAAASLRRVQRVHCFDVDVRDRRDYELRDAVAAVHGEGLGAEVHEDDADLAAIVRVDGAGRIDDADAVPEREAGAGAHLAFVAFRDRDLDSGRHESPSAGWDRDGLGDGRSEIETGGARALVSGKWKVRARDLLDHELRPR